MFYRMAHTEEVANAARNVATRRDEAGLNNNSLSRATGISYSTLTRHLEGTDPGFTIPQLRKIAATLNTTVADLLK